MRLCCRFASLWGAILSDNGMILSGQSGKGLVDEFRMGNHASGHVGMLGER